MYKSLKQFRRKRGGMGVVRIIIGFVIAVLAGAAAATSASSVAVLARLAAIGADIAPATGAAMLVQDLRGLAPSYAVILGLGFAVAFPCAALAGRVLALPRWVVFATAGAASVGVTLMAMKAAFFGVTAIAGARGAAGAAGQALAGALAGLAYVLATRPARAKMGNN